jgi:hypothetical protein
MKENEDFDYLLQSALPEAPARLRGEVMRRIAKLPRRKRLGERAWLAVPALAMMAVFGAGLCTYEWLYPNSDTHISLDAGSYIMEAREL